MWFESTALRPHCFESGAVLRFEYWSGGFRSPRPHSSGAPSQVGALFISALSYFFFGSRFCCRSSAVTADSTPPAGTSSLASHTSALSTTLRWLSSPQFLCLWPPVNPKPRPPPSRSTHHIMVSSWPAALTMWSYGPLG